VSLALLVLAASLFGSSREWFFQYATVGTVAGQMAVIGVMAVGMTFVILTGGIDLSVGSMCALIGVCGAKLALGGHPLWQCAAAMLLLGALLGLINGVLVAATTVQPFVITLASMASLRGAAYLISPNNVSGFPKLFEPFQGAVYGLPVNAILLISLVVIGWWILRRTVFGRYVYAVGGNETACRYSAAPVARTKVLVYTINGICVGLAAILLIARTNNGEPGGATAYELDAIAAVVIGGASLVGGYGSVVGTLFGAVFMQTLSHLMVLWGIGDKLALLLKGPIILAAVLLQANRRR
jgi:ribose transport system permease protein